MGGMHAYTTPYLTALTTYFSYAVLILFGHTRDFYRRALALIMGRAFLAPSSDASKTSDSLGSLANERAGAVGRSGVQCGDMAPMLEEGDDFYTRRMFARIQDCFSRPINSAPDARFNVMEREEDKDNKWSLKSTGRSRPCLNLGSYNYLGFAASDPYCTPRSLEASRRYGWAQCSSTVEAGTSPVLAALESRVARYVGKESAIVYGMGFATNSSTIPVLMGKGSLIISDSLNHRSIVSGVRLSGARVKVFRHNDATHLEKVLRAAISEGQPRTREPWKKILVIVEGIYSMEGHMCNLREIVEIKKKYGAYLFLDEAHSIGAMGASGRGVCEHLGIDTADVDIMMGTFTKSFGSCGGYIASNHDVIAHIKRHSPSTLYAASMSAPAAMQALSALEILMGDDDSRGERGQAKIAQLHDNANYFREQLKSMGCQILGDEDSPIMPLMLYNPSKIAAFSRECFKRGVAVVVVGFPATDLVGSRARFCLSAAHSRADLDEALEVVREVSSRCAVRYELKK